MASKKLPKIEFGFHPVIQLTPAGCKVGESARIHRCIDFVFQDLPKSKRRILRRELTKHGKSNLAKSGTPAFVG